MSKINDRWGFTSAPQRLLDKTRHISLILSDAINLSLTVFETLENSSTVMYTGRTLEFLSKEMCRKYYSIGQNFFQFQEKLNETTPYPTHFLLHKIQQFFQCRALQTIFISCDMFST